MQQAVLNGVDEYSSGLPELAIVETNIPALDGYVLGGTLFERVGEYDPACAVVLASGGGIPATRYRHFATFFAAAGIPVLTFDYRGIARSRRGSLRGFEARAEDWSEWDCGGAIAWMRARYPRADLAGVAHSIGALMIGGAPNVSELSRLVFIAPHTGYYGDYAKRHRLPMAVLWHGIMPILTRIFGYFPARLLRLGENIPAGMALQWAARRTPELRPEATDSDGVRGRSMLARFGQIRIPALAVSFADDAFATVEGTRRLLDVYPGLSVTQLVLDPAAVGMESIGHFGFFRQSAEALIWPLVLDYFRDTTPASPKAMPLA